MFEGYTEAELREVRKQDVKDIVRFINWTWGKIGSACRSFLAGFFFTLGAAAAIAVILVIIFLLGPPEVPSAITTIITQEV